MIEYKVLDIYGVYQVLLGFVKSLFFLFQGIRLADIYGMGVRVCIHMYIWKQTQQIRFFLGQRLNWYLSCPRRGLPVGTNLHLSPNRKFSSFYGRHRSSKLGRPGLRAFRSEVQQILDRQLSGTVLRSACSFGTQIQHLEGILLFLDIKIYTENLIWPLCQLRQLRFCCFFSILLF